MHLFLHLLSLGFLYLCFFLDVMCETDLYCLQEGWEKKEIHNKVFNQLTSDLLAHDEYNQNEGYVLSWSEVHLKLEIESFDPPKFKTNNKSNGASGQFLISSMPFSMGEDLTRSELEVLAKCFT